ncbi:MAG: penicillin-binding protein 2 [Nitratiruptor sp.]|nr:penicillin-binding protein 2 [Nitratiruptor sp.]NPA83727.1 penicillin-binding protein 2 [Campylobacterota bacterium]
MATSSKTLKIASLFLLFVLGILIFLLAVVKIVVEDRKLPKLVITDKNRAVRGSIISADGYQLTYSNKLYKVAVNTRCIDPAKRDLFINLVHIYSDIPKDVLRRKLQKRGYVVLSYNIDAKRAYQLKLLSRKLYQMDMFVPYRVGNNYIKQGLTIQESGETRKFPYHDILTPVIGYVRKYEEEGYTKISGVKGLERYYEDWIKPRQDGLIRGKRDIGNNIILNKEAIIKKRIDGYNIHLNVNVLLQKILEHIIDTHRADLGAKEILAAVMESDTGRILAMATSNRFDPAHIRKRDYDALNAKFVEYPFEPGSVMKPITFALLLEHKLVNPFEVVKGYNGRYKLGNKVITDEHKRAWLSAENVIVYSSNIGIAQLAQRLPYDLFYTGLRRFGFGQKTGIDLPYEHSGSLMPLQRFKQEIYKATIGYGYSIRATFVQLLYAYNAFNNEGRTITPRIAAFLSEANGKRKELPQPKIRQVISSKTANTVRQILKKVVEKGTGTAAKIDGLFIAGKTGTAHIARNGRYTNSYNSSFFGFANDGKHRYTIGVTVIEPTERYFASQTAVPVFRDIVLELVNEGYLTPQ